MFIQNYKTQVYYSIIDRAMTRTLGDDIVTETHHIIPKSLGGGNEAENLAVLTPREHFICHWLLTKMVQGKDEWKMMNALGFMMWAENDNQERYKVNSRMYEQLKTKHSKLKSIAMMGDRNPNYGKKWLHERKDAHSAKVTGMKLTEEQRAKVSASKLGVKRKPFSKEHIANLSEAKSGEKNAMFGKNHTDETKRKQSIKATGRKQSAETIKKKADAVRGSKRVKKHCPHCHRDIAVNVYPRFHGNKCKSKT